MFSFIFTPDKSSKKPLYEQLYAYIAREIRGKSIEEGEKMPSKKALAKHLGISVNTVETAYALLAQEGYIRSVPRSGFYVCRIDLPVSAEKTPIFYVEEKKERKFTADFGTNAVDVSSFPYATWIKLSKEVMYSNPEYLRSSDVKGDFELRASIAKYLHEFRGVVCSPKQIVVGAGMEYLIMLLAELLGDKPFALENPGYGRINTILKNGGRKINYIELDADGLRPDKLRKTNSDIVYLTPSHQFPTGAVMPVARRNEILAWAREKDGRYIIEDDYNGEFNFTLRPLPSVQGLDGGERVVYLSTFSRVLAPSIRIAYMVLPPTLMKSFEERFSSYSSTVPRFEQHTLDKFISDGYFSRHLSRVKNIYRKRRDNLIRAVSAPDVKVSGTRAGLHIVAETPRAYEILAEAEKRGMRLRSLDDYYMDKKVKSNALVIGYAGAGDADIEKLGELFKTVR